MLLGFSGNTLPQLHKFENLVILVEDIQEKFLDQLYEEDAKTLIHSTKQVLKEAIHYDIPIAVLETRYKGTDFGPTAPELQEIYAKGRYKQIDKHKQNGFLETALDNYFQEINNKHILIIGMHANECIRSTIQGGTPNYTFITAGNLIESKKEHKPQELTLYNVHKEAMRWIKHNTIFYTSFRE